MNNSLPQEPEFENFESSSFSTSLLELFSEKEIQVKVQTKIPLSAVLLLLMGPGSHLLLF